jgi:DNA-binding transcriptional MerR regulator
LTPSRDKNGIRQFDDTLLKRIDKIKILKEFGFRLRDIEAILNHQTTAEAHEIVQTRREMLEQQTQNLLISLNMKQRRMFKKMFQNL